MNQFSLIPKNIPKTKTKYRTIKTELPVPDSLPIINKLREHEAKSMQGQPPILWDSAEGINIMDRFGNKWIDWSSGCLITNVGHNHENIKKALSNYLESKAPLATYCFSYEARSKLVEKLIEISPQELNKVFLLSTGSEATEVSIKLARTKGIRKDPKKRKIISFENGFHGRTYAARLAGGISGIEWIDPNDNFVQVPFPGSLDTLDKSFKVFTSKLEKLGINPKEVAGVISESYQGREAKLMPKEYAQNLRKWCDENDAALIFDEVQSGFGRTGKLFSFEHQDIIPDLVCCGKGISSSLPLSAVIGKKEFLDLYGPGQMTSTHTGSPLSVVAGLSNIETILDEGLIEKARINGEYLGNQLKHITEPYEDKIEVGGVGMVYAMLFFNNRDELKPDSESAFNFCEQAFYSGNLFFAPVGKGNGAIKFCPPLCMDKNAINDGIYAKNGIKHTIDMVMKESK